MEQAERFVAEYQSRYTDALDAARKAAITTATDAWQASYAEAKKRHKKLRRDCVEKLKEIAASVRGDDLTADMEKELREVVKSLKTERIAAEVWENRAVQPYRGAVDLCDALREQVFSAAHEAEDRAPLHMRGLAHDVRELVNRWPRAVWDAKTGVVTVS